MAEVVVSDNARAGRAPTCTRSSKWTRAELFDLIREFLDDFAEPLSFRGRDPLEPEPFRLDPEILEDEFECFCALLGLNITILVMTVADVSPAG